MPGQSCWGKGGWERGHVSIRKALERTEGPAGRAQVRTPGTQVPALESPTGGHNANVRPDGDPIDIANGEAEDGIDIPDLTSDIAACLQQKTHVCPQSRRKPSRLS